jgi:HK97 gp10 family phage protein
MSSRIEGMSKTALAMKRMGAETVKQVEKALDEGAEEIAAKARQIAPRDTGELASAIEVRNSLDGFTATGAVGYFGRMVSGSAAGLTRFIGVMPKDRKSPGWYAAWVEWGTTTRAPQPFVKPAFFSLQKKVQGRIGRAVNKAIREVAARGGSGS